ncbi:MAG: outer membrane protein assembly factor BamE [Verrucomicrobiota bacterium]|nr:outer membrane protein assembly factor BamE [Verrucomicrobiota bacterium]
MNPRYPLLALLAAAACSSGGSTMTLNSFSDIPLGATKDEVVASVGKPDLVKKHSDGSIEYEYVERVKIGARDVEERRYLIKLKDGKVVSKKIKGKSEDIPYPTPYVFDSYEMQTTQVEEGAKE